MAAHFASLRTKRDFTRCTRTGRRQDHSLLRLYALRRPEAGEGGAAIRVGCVASRRLGNAVRRNRIRRVLREACRRWAADARGNWDVVIVPQPQARGAAADALRGALGELLAAAGVD